MFLYPKITNLYIYCRAKNQVLLLPEAQERSALNKMVGSGKATRKPYLNWALQGLGEEFYRQEETRELGRRRKRQIHGGQNKPF